MTVKNPRVFVIFNLLIMAGLTAGAAVSRADDICKDAQTQLDLMDSTLVTALSHGEAAVPFARGYVESGSISQTDSNALYDKAHAYSEGLSPVVEAVEALDGLWPVSQETSVKMIHTKIAEALSPIKARVKKLMMPFLTATLCPQDENQAVCQARLLAPLFVASEHEGFKTKAGAMAKELRRFVIESACR